MFWNLQEVFYVYISRLVALPKLKKPVYPTICPKSAKNIYYTKGKGADDPSTVTRYLKKFHSDCKILDALARSGRPKTAGSEAVLQAIKENLKSSIQRVSCDVGISQSNVVRYFFDFNKEIWSYQMLQIFSFNLIYFKNYFVYIL